MPLILLVAAGRAKGQFRAVLMLGRTGRQRRSGPSPRAQRLRQPLVQPEHLRAGIQRKAKRGYNRARLQPPARGHGRCHIAPAIHHVEMHRIATLFGKMRHGRLARTDTPCAGSTAAGAMTALARWSNSTNRLGRCSKLARSLRPPNRGNRRSGASHNWPATPHILAGQNTSVPPS